MKFEDLEFKYFDGIEEDSFWGVAEITFKNGNGLRVIYGTHAFCDFGWNYEISVLLYESPQRIRSWEDSRVKGYVEPEKIDDILRAAKNLETNEEYINWIEDNI